ncbi:hypothetical protein TELCIR_03305 [Teladorsagia circumcincta]|uniref:Uncharacterized protein n=1 Tax=Teladorsagia circumcincta TaxID=45464 RepID=A0A2G9UWP7_TELCI|nr:hypothetical protein TELCIR_03305 [Teladorsagia circumcincta]
MRYSPRVLVASTPKVSRFSRVYVEPSTRRASPVERRIHEKRLLAKIVETRKRRLELEEIYKLYIKYIKAMENELRIQEREMQKAREKLMQMLENEESFETPRPYEFLQEAGDNTTNVNKYHPLDDEELWELSDSTVSSHTAPYSEMSYTKSNSSEDL